MKDLGVNLTEVLVAKEKVPDKTFRFEGAAVGTSNGANGQSIPKVQLHLNEDKAE